MSYDVRSRHERTCLILATCVLTMVLFYLLTPSSYGKGTDLSQRVTLKSETLNSDSSESGSPDPDSPNLKPPSQEWVHAQFYKAMSLLDWEYVPPNNWEKCTPRTYFFPKINTMFTGIPKTGCSNWLIALLGVEGELDREVDPTKLEWVHGSVSDRHRIGRIVEQYDRSVLQKAFSFTVVRNPWTRMVSGFRQKLSSENTQGSSFRWMGMTIVREMRGVVLPIVFLKDLYPTFEEYVRYLINRAGQIDRHFTMQTNELCIPHAMYDFIVPLEYSASLSQEVWSRINGSDASLLGSYDKASDSRLQSSALDAKEWLSKLDPEIIEQVYKIYKGDFIMMNYSNFTHPDFPLPLHSPPT